MSQTKHSSEPSQPDFVREPEDIRRTIAKLQNDMSQLTKVELSWILASVNACAGLTTEQLQGLKVKELLDCWNTVTCHEMVNPKTTI